ncbi:MAG: L,D-transpeptidase, partial [Longimicrobiales bacterium]
PSAVRPATDASSAVRRKAIEASGTRIVVSIDARALWLMRGDEIVHSAPVAVGKHEGFTYGGKRYDFRTPIGVRKVLSKSPDPIWTPPDWHYFEKIVERGLEPVRLERGTKVELEDGSRVEIRGDQVGRVNQFGNFAPFTPGNEIVFDGKLFIPPFGTAQRRIPEILGTHKLEMGDAYLIHGTPERYTIGEAVSHGCIRMYNEDVSRLYELVPLGTAIYIF